MVCQAIYITMLLKDQVLSYLLAKKLHDIGVYQTSWFYWYEKEIVSTEYIESLSKTVWQTNRHKTYCAFSVAELGDMLPDSYMTGKLFLPEDSPTQWAIWAHNSVLQEGSPLQWTYAQTQVECMGKMLMWLLEHEDKNFTLNKLNDKLSGTTYYTSNPKIQL